MPERIIETTCKNFTAGELLAYINEEKKLHLNTLGEAITNLGLGVVGMAVIPGIAATLAGVISVGIAVADLIDYIKEAMEAEKLAPIIDRVNKEGGKVRVCTDIIEWSSGSGNSYAYYAKDRYSYVK